MSKSISLPWPVIEPEAPPVEVQSLNHWTDKEVHVISLKILYVLKIWKHITCTILHLPFHAAIYYFLSVIIDLLSFKKLFNVF